MSEPIDVDLLDDSVEFTLEDLCRICGVREAVVTEIVQEGVVEPRRSGESWRFTGVAVTRIQRVIRLQREFEVNLPGAALALELLEEIERLKRRMR
jgi:chaperone modulatory protein CbpM